MTAPLCFLKLPTTPDGYDMLLEADELERGQLLTMLYWLALHPNAGRISDIRNWSSSRLYRAFGWAEPPAEVPGLWHYDGDDLIVDVYPVEAEQALQMQREAGRQGGRPAKKPTVKTLGYDNIETQGQNPIRKEKRRTEQNTHTAHACVCEDESVCVCVCEKTSEEEEHYIRALADAHPATAQMEVLPEDVLQAGREAYKRTPGAMEHTALLQAYMADNLAEDHKRKAFFRPYSPVQFFAKIENIVLEARRWARETRYKAPRRAQNAPGRNSNTNTPQSPQTPLNGNPDAKSSSAMSALCDELGETINNF